MYLLKSYEDAEYLELWEEETVAVSLIISELITNAMKHRDPDSADSDGLRIVLNNDESTMTIEVANAVNTDEVTPFDFDHSLNSGGVGLGMVQSLMPPEGASLNYQQIDGFVVATLTLHPPVILNIFASEMNVLEAIS